MCNHFYEELFPVFDDGGSIECADVVLKCSLLDDASFVLKGWAEYAEGFDQQQDGRHRELRYVMPAPIEQQPELSIEQQPEFDDEIPF